jgi:hypothetical protein
MEPVDTLAPEPVIPERVKRIAAADKTRIMGPSAAKLFGRASTAELSPPVLLTRS